MEGSSEATLRAAARAAALLDALLRRGVGRGEAQRLVLDHAIAEEDWSRVHPAILGELFLRGMPLGLRHAQGAHFTRPAELQKILGPTVVKPFEERLSAAGTRDELASARAALARYRILDPACGTGNFLYEAYRALVRLELSILRRLSPASPALSVSLEQLHGIDIDPLAVEIARATLLLARRLACDEARAEGVLPGPDDRGPELLCTDALFCPWPKVDAIVGNPPYQSKNKMQAELGPAYKRRLEERYPDVPGSADYCVYWFRRAHDELPPGGRAGLVGTNTIRQNASREGGLDHIVKDGTITDAVSTQTWSGDAAVHVSIVNWVKGPEEGRKTLSWQEGHGPNATFRTVEVPVIHASLSTNVDITAAARLRANAGAGACYQGQTHGHEGFLLPPREAQAMIRAHRENANVLFPYLIADDLLGSRGAAPSRYVIDFHPRDMLEASRYKEPFARVEALVLPARRAAAGEETARNAELLRRNPKARVNRHHEKFLRQWWLLSWPRPELIRKLGALPRYIACARVTKRAIFAFVSSSIRPSDALQVFPLADDYSFGILQSQIHWAWFTERCSTLKGDFRYTSNTVFDTFPWPQDPSALAMQNVAAAAAALRSLRLSAQETRGLSLRDLHRSLELPGRSPLKEAQEALDAAVREAYGMKPGADVLAFLLDLNLALARREARGEAITAPLRAAPSVP